MARREREEVLLFIVVPIADGRKLRALHAKERRRRPSLTLARFTRELVMRALKEGCSS